MSYTHTLVSASVDEYDVRATTRQPVTVTEDGVFGPLGNLIARSTEDLATIPTFLTLEDGAPTPISDTITVGREELFEALQALAAVPFYLDGEAIAKAHSFALAAISHFEAALNIKTDHEDLD